MHKQDYISCILPIKLNFYYASRTIEMHLHKFTYYIAWPPISTINFGINILKPTETRLNLHLNQYDLVRVDQNFLCKYKAIL